jgi:hypothetical protein
LAEADKASAKYVSSSLAFAIIFLFGGWIYPVSTDQTYISGYLVHAFTSCKESNSENRAFMLCLVKASSFEFV